MNSNVARSAWCQTSASYGFGLEQLCRALGCNLPAVLLLLEAMDQAIFDFLWKNRLSRSCVCCQAIWIRVNAAKTKYVLSNAMFSKRCAELSLRPARTHLYKSFPVHHIRLPLWDIPLRDDRLKTREKRVMLDNVGLLSSATNTHKTNR